MRQDSTAITGTAVTIADGYQSADPQQFTVTMENVNGGSLRSILTILQPNPDSSQVNLPIVSYLKIYSIKKYDQCYYDDIIIGSILLSTSF